MKMKQYLVFAFCMVAMQLRAQNQLTNGNMETWEQRTVAGYSFSDPNSWYSLNELGKFGIPNTTLKSTDAHGGTAAAHLFSANSAFGVIPGLLTVKPIIDVTGDPDLNLNFIPFTYRPSSIQFWFKSFPETNDKNVMFCFTSKWNPTTQQRDTIAYASWEMDSTYATYTNAVVNFTYNSVQNPDSLSLIFASSEDGFDPIEGSEFFVDDITLSYATGMKEPVLSNQMFMYPNPTKGNLTIESERKLMQANALDAYGKLIKLEINGSNHNSISLENLRDGLYVIELFFEGIDQAIYQKVIKQN